MAILVINLRLLYCISICFIFCDLHPIIKIDWLHIKVTLRYCVFEILGIWRVLCIAIAFYRNKLAVLNVTFPLDMSIFFILQLLSICWYQLHKLNLTANLYSFLISTLIKYSHVVCTSSNNHFNSFVL